MKTRNAWNKGIKTGYSPRKGVKLSEETKLKISKSKKGQTSPNKGKKLSQIHKQKLSLAKMGKYRGENSPHWKGGISSHDYLERRRFRNQIQKLVFERDNYTCQLCGIRGVDLQVDHIQSWAEYIELRFSISNCRTLCAKCHYKITFGKPMPAYIKAFGHNLLKGGKQL